MAVAAPVNTVFFILYLPPIVIRICNKKAEDSASAAALAFPKIENRQQPDSTPHICDSKTDIIRVARTPPAPWEIFGTEPFRRRNACAGFFAANTLVVVRLYHLFCQYITFSPLCQGIGDILSVLGAYFLNGNKKRRRPRLSAVLGY
ncbi:MAG: hypothetical protein IJ345_08315 [Clostridia bacterium]|nr:hypothetical protein [Clostridia bacterium]